MRPACHHFNVNDLKMFTMLLYSLKLNQVSLDCEPHNPSRLAFAKYVVGALNQFAERQLMLSGKCFHGTESRTSGGYVLWGESLP